MQLEAPTQDLMGHKTIKSEHFLFEPETFQSEVWGFSRDWPPMKAQVEESGTKSHTLQRTDHGGGELSSW